MSAAKLGPYLLGTTVRAVQEAVLNNPSFETMCLIEELFERHQTLRDEFFRPIPQCLQTPLQPDYPQPQPTPTITIENWDDVPDTCLATPLASNRYRQLPELERKSWPQQVVALEEGEATQQKLTFERIPAPYQSSSSEESLVMLRHTDELLAPQRYAWCLAPPNWD